MKNRFAALAAALTILLMTVGLLAWDSGWPAKGELAPGIGPAGPSAESLAGEAPTRWSVSPVPTARPIPVVTGTASHYPGTAGFAGEPTVALPGAMGGRYTGERQGYVTVCADRCVRLAVVDWCECYWGTRDERVADISHAAWPLITDQPLSSGLVQVRVFLTDPELAAEWRQDDRSGSGGSS